MDAALFWEVLDKSCAVADGEELLSGDGGTQTAGRVRCTLCFHRCVLGEGKAGFCGVRVNRGGELRTLVRDNIVSANLDPVEKKPLFHFLPGTATLSIGTYGCNFACRFCQNSGISRSVADNGTFVPGTRIEAQELVRLAVRKRIPSISCTYNEPTVYYELMADIADRAVAENVRMIMVSNGCMSRESLRGLQGRIQAANIDLKAFSKAFYRDICAGSLQEVLDNLCLMKEMGIWLEITTLVIPGLNDSEEELRAIARFIREHLGRETPWHVSAFHPCYRMKDRPPTSPAAIHAACELGRAEGLDFVYGGNVFNPQDESTWCPSCHTLCIARQGFRVQRSSGGICPVCGHSLPGVWE